MKISLITTNELAFLEALVNNDVEMELVITNNPYSEVIDFCKEKSILCKVIDHTNYADREEHDMAIKMELDKFDLDLVILGSYLRLIKSKDFLDEYKGKMISVHNSYLPNFSGIKPEMDAFNAGVKESGFTIHFVDAVMDMGEILFQKSVCIKDCKNPDEVYRTIVDDACENLHFLVNLFKDKGEGKSLKPLISRKL